MQNVPVSHLDVCKISVFCVSCKNPCRDRVGLLPQNGHNRGKECWTPSRRIFESLSWVMDAGDPVDNCSGAQLSWGEGEVDYLWTLCAAMSSQILSEECLMMLTI